MRFSLVTILLLCLAVLEAAAQTLPSGIINIPGTYSSIGDNRSIGSNTTLNVTGSSIGFNFRAGSSSGSNPNIQVNISGGRIGLNFIAYRNVDVNISGGDFDILFAAASGSTVDISGGSFDAFFTASSGSNVNVTGGSFSRGFRARAGSNVSLFGGEFLVNGSLASGNVTLGTSDILTGTLEDGTPFIFCPLGSDDIQNVLLVNHPLPPLNTAPIVINSEASPRGLRAGQTLTLLDGGELPENFAVVAATLNVEGGTVQPGLDATDSVVNISGGTVLSLVQAFDDTVVTVSGDATTGSIYGFMGSEVNIQGGSLGDFSRVENGSQFNISGGSIGSFLEAFSGGVVNASGGSFGRYFEQNIGSDITFHGGEFRLNGSPISGTVSLVAGDQLTGTFSDGSPFAFSGRVGDALKQVTLVTEPLPAINLAPITVASGIGPTGLRSGQVLTLQNGGSLPSNFTALNATLDIHGGSVGKDLEVVGTTLNVTSGTIGDGLVAMLQGKVNVSGGVVGTGILVTSGSVMSVSGGSVGGTADEGIRVEDGSVLNVSGGQVGQYVYVGQGSVVNVSGGTIAGTIFSASTNSVVNISGGTLGNGLDALTGSEINISGGTLPIDFDANTGSNVNLLGKQFILNGVDITNTLTEGVPLTIQDRNVTLSGILGDDSPFSYALNTSGPFNSSIFSAGALLTVTLLSSGDFDRDGDVDGRDFLMWQRSPSVGDLADWQSDYQANLLVATTAVPEPNAILLSAFSIAAGLVRRVR